MAENFPDLILNDGSKPLEANKNDYFLVTITDLLPGKTYPIEFRWNYSDSAKKPDWGAVLKVTTPANAIGIVQNVSASWVNEVFTLQFTHDRTLSQNINVVSYKIKLLASDNTPAQDVLIPVAGNSQKYTADVAKIISLFNFPVFELSGEIIAVDKDGNESAAVSFPLTTATTSLPAPVISVEAIQAGYSVSYTTPSLTQYPYYNNISIEEVESNSSTDPGSGYTAIFNGIANPAIINRSNTAKRWVRARFFSKLNRPGPYSTAVSVSPTPAAVIDSTGPSAPSSGLNISGGIDSSSGAAIGFNGYLDLSWTAVSDSTLRGYRIRFRTASSGSSYSYVDSPGTGTTYRLNALAVGATYEVGIAAYDEFNNVSSSYQSFTNTAVGGTPFVGTNVNTTGYFSAGTSPNDFQFGYGIDPSNNSGTFAGTKRGLYFTSSNYWVIDSAQSAKFKVGGPSSNYLLWDGSALTIDGNITANQGTFKGNVQIQSGGLYAGASPSSGARLAITPTGLTAFDSGGTGTTNIYSNITSGGVTFTTTAATIGGWNVTSNEISKVTGSNATLILDAANNNIRAYVGTEGSTTNNRVVMQAPTSASSYVLYAGNATAASAAFSVTANGALTATSATITGAIKATSGFIGSSDGSTGWTITSNALQSVSGSVILNGTTGTISGATIEGSTITTNGSTSDGTIRISNSNNAIEFLYGGTAVSSIYPFNLGSEIIIQQGVPGFIRYPQSRAYISISSGTATIGYANSSGSRSVGFSIDSTSISAFVGSGGLVTSGGPIYTGANTTVATDQTEGISLTQGGTLSARRSNANPLNLHRFNVTAATTTSVSVIDFYRNGTARGTLEIFGNTSAPVLVGSSDYRLKENVRDYSGGLNKILQTQVKVFNEIEDEEKNDIVGFIAHEFAEVFPEYVIGEKDAVDEDGNPIYQKLSHSNLTPYLISAIKELSQRLDALEG